MEAGARAAALADALAARIEAGGPIGFDEFVDHALYAPELGFYAAGGGAGRRRDFLTSPEVGPLFGAVVASALDRWWDHLGRPDPFPVVEAGAGPGTLARAILAAGPRCGGALELVLVERAEVQWATHPPGVSTRADLPAPGELGVGPVVVLANELLDNLPFGLLERGPAGWDEILVDLAPAAGGSDGGGPRFVEVHRPLEPIRAAWCHGRAGRDVAVGARIPVQADAAAWLDRALALAGPGGGVVVLDYASTTPALARRPWTDWVRTYAAHGRGGGPLDAPGTCDLTVEVATDQLAPVERPSRNRSQAAFLAAHGIEALVAEGRARWAAEGYGGGVAALAARSRVPEAAALTDPAGLGAFRVLEWWAGPVPEP